MTRIITDQFSIPRISPLALVHLLPLCGTLANRSVETFRWEYQICWWHHNAAPSNTEKYSNSTAVNRPTNYNMFWLSTVKLKESQYLTDILTLSIFQKRYEKKRTTKHTWDTHPSITTSVPQHKVAMPPRQRSFWAWHWFCVVSLDWCVKRWQTNSVLLPAETIYQNESNMQGKQLERIQLWGALLLHNVNLKSIFWVQRFAYVAHHVVLLTVWPDRRYVHRRK